MGRWVPNSQTRETGGRFRLFAYPPNGAPVDITTIRGKPVTIGNYSTADPFGYAAARFDFPMLTGFDAVGSGELAWLTRHTSLVLRHIPEWAGTEALDPITQRKSILPIPPGSEPTFVVWEGVAVNFGQNQNDTGDTWSLDCVGTLYQADGYKAKPSFPRTPVPYEVLLAEGFNRTLHPHLKTQKDLEVRFPAGWTKIATAAMVTDPTIFRPSNLKVGQKYTGYSTRQTGAWDSWLTSFAQNLLSVMWVDTESGVTPGNQWTLMCEAGGKPVLKVRDRYGDPDITFWYGTPGIQVSGMTHDFSQAFDILYGQGTALDGTGWRNAIVSPDGGHTSYAPLVVDESVWPEDASNDLLDESKVIRERMVNFSPGISLEQANQASGQMAAWDRDPGWTGTVTFTADPVEMDKWKIAAGMRILMKGFAGTGKQGQLFHIAETSADPQAGTVTATIDTKFRDALALEETRARTRDPLTPSKLLQVNRRSITIEDQLAPWDYSAGSGLMPRRKLSKSFFADLPPGQRFPWVAQALKYPPKSHKEYYIKVRAAASGAKKKHWSFFEILMSEKGTIADLMMAAYDRNGVQRHVEFHLSLYDIDVDRGNMPADEDGEIWPFFTGAFQSTTVSGDPLPAEREGMAPDKSMIIGWGNIDQPAGYSPGSKSDGDPMTGRLQDSSTWTFDLTQNGEFDLYLEPGAKQSRNATQIYGAIYCEDTRYGPLYFLGRMFRQEPGT